MSDPAPPPAALRRRWLSPVWLVPLVAAAVAAYLGWQALAERGQPVTITFHTADGLSAGQTPVRYKAVQLGTVDDVRLSPDMSRVVVDVRMSREAAPILTDHARFWVVRPRLAARGISGLETIVSGAYIAVDPGPPGGKPQTRFTGLEEPPGVRSDEPGRNYVLSADRIGSLGAGSPVFYRDMPVGEVLSVTLAEVNAPARVSIFVRSPYDQFVRTGTLFWNASGITASYGVEGLHVEMESLQAVLAGGIAFSTPDGAADTPVAADHAEFPLYRGERDATAARHRERVPFVAYFQGPVGGLDRGSPVTLYGIQIGVVTGVTLRLDTTNGRPTVRVAMDIEPGRVFSREEIRTARDPFEVVQQLVRSGMRVALETPNLLTAQPVVAFEFTPGAPPAAVEKEADAILVPSQPGGSANVMNALGDVADRLRRLPLEQIATHLDELVGTAHDILAGPELQDALRSLSATLRETQKLVRAADTNLAPALRRLPQISNEFQQTMSRANQAIESVARSYGGDSDFRNELQRAMTQIGDAARAVRLLADFLDRHPEALVRGRANSATGP